MEVEFLKGKWYINNTEATPEEVLFLIEFYSGKINKVNNKADAKKENVEVGKVLDFFKKEALGDYLFYRDAKLKGFKIEKIKNEKSIKKGDYLPTKKIKKYKADFKKLPKMKGVLLEKPIITFIIDNKAGKELYLQNWFGQYGVYKHPEIGKFNKLDLYEAYFLIKNRKITNIKPREFLRIATKNDKRFYDSYQAYEDWRKNGYVIKTGFKFGCDFRLYPKTRPKNNLHSKYTIDVIPKTKIKVSELARAIRVAHSVKKKFIIALPKIKKSKNLLNAPYLLKKEEKEFVVLPLNEVEDIELRKIVDLIYAAKKLKRRAAVAIVDRETSVTYYEVNELKLENSKMNYFEIDWIKP